jgi:hypothetical protein
MELRLVHHPKYSDMYAVSGYIEGECGETLWVDYTLHYAEAKNFFDAATTL